MRRVFAAVVLCSLAPAAPARADDAEVKAVIDKAVKALGGKEALAKAWAFRYETRDRFQVAEGMPDERVTRKTIEGVESCRLESFPPGPVVEGDLDCVYVVARGRGWIKSSGRVREFTDWDVEQRRPGIAWDAAPVNLAPLRDGTSKIEPAGEQAVEGKPAVGLKVTRPDVTFTIYFDRESGLPVRCDRRLPPNSDSVEQVAFREYKDFGGLKVATSRVTIRVATSRATIRAAGAAPWMTALTEVTDFKALGKVDPATFARPD